MQSAVVARMNINSPLLYIHLQAYAISDFIGLSNNEKIIKAVPDITTPHNPSQNTASSTFTAYWRSIFS